MSHSAIHRRLDLRGHVCPGPTVDTRLTLKEMAPGEVLEVVTDYYPARTLGGRLKTGHSPTLQSRPLFGERSRQ
jgi:sulfurtransferase TusA-like protein